MNTNFNPINKTPFEVNDLSSANWTVRKVLEHQAAIDDIKLQANIMKADIDNWRDSEVESHQKSIDSLSARLQPFVAALADKQNKRSINLPAGRVGFRKGNVTFFYGHDQADRNNEQLLIFLIDNGLTNFIKTEINETVDWAALKKTLNVTDDGRVVSADGELIEAMSVKQEPDTFYVQPFGQ